MEAERELAKRELARRHLKDFLQQAWPTVEPGVEYRHGWHIEAISEHLEAVHRGEIRKLVINIPPRHMKSLTMSVFFPAWVWTSDPARKFLYSSYAQNLAYQHSRICRRLIQSEWYQTRWPVKLLSDQNVKSLFENEHTGARLAVSVSSDATGFGADYVICDDPHKIEERHSEVRREAVIDWWDNTMSTRLNNPKKGAHIVIMQRLHEADLSGHLLEKGWHHLCLPAEYEPKHPFVWPDDPRIEPGELLWPDHVDAQYLTDRKEDLGSRGYAGLYQQRPAPAEGAILKREWWKYWPTDRPLPPQWQRQILSWDLTFGGDTGSSYVCGQVWGQDGANLYLLDRVRGKWEYVEQKRQLRLLRDRWPEATTILVEDAAAARPLISDLRDTVPGLVKVKPEGDKVARAEAVAPTIEAGNVYLPPESWVEGFIEECASFPEGVNDDQVDCMSQALRRLASNLSGGGSVPYRDEPGETRIVKGDLVLEGEHHIDLEDRKSTLWR